LKLLARNVDVDESDNMRFFISPANIPRTGGGTGLQKITEEIIHVTFIMFIRYCSKRDI